MLALLPDSAPQPKQAVGQLIWQVTVTAGNELRLWFTVAGSHTGQARSLSGRCGRAATTRLVAAPQGSGRLALLARSRADIPNVTLQAAFDWAKLNLADMRRVIIDAQIQDTHNGTQQGKSTRLC